MHLLNTEILLDAFKVSELEETKCEEIISKGLPNFEELNAEF